MEKHKSPVYPRPSLRRKSFILLDGEWEFAFSDKTSVEAYPLKINVPYPPESKLSGIGSLHKKGEFLHYRRTFTLPLALEGRRLILHIGAADQIAVLYINGKKAGEHRGGYLPFDADITEYVTEGENTVSVRVLDDLCKAYPYGKQSDKPGGMWYTQFSGIWKSVWAEIVPQNYIENLRITPSGHSVTFEVYGGENEKTVLFDGREEHFSGQSATFEINNPKMWSPESPYLYSLKLICGKDEVDSYFALRTLTVETYDGISRLCLNGKPYFFNGVLDQGYFSDGICTPPDEDAFKNDILYMKSLGFNTLRKHIKIEPDLFYYECDRLGMIVFQDAVNNGEYRFLHDTALPTLGITAANDTKTNTPADVRENFKAQLKGEVALLYNHPCICLWTIFNEGWGQHDSGRYADMLSQWDKTRFIDEASGWFETKHSKLKSLHVYFKPVKLKATEKPVLLTEFGGYALSLDEKNKKGAFGYKFMKTKEELTEGIIKLYNRDIIPNIKKGLCAAIYTQLSDVENEINGLYSYDRKTCKVDSAKIKETMDKIKNQ